MSAKCQKRTLSPLCGCPLRTVGCAVTDQQWPHSAYRPMTLEAIAGKNPITHVGKLCSTAANQTATALVTEVPAVSAAERHLVSQIGTPIDRPRVVRLRVKCHEKILPPAIKDRIRAVAEREIARIPELWKSFLAADVSVA